MTKEQEEWWEQIFHDTLRGHKFMDEETNILETDCSTPMSPFGIHNMVRRIVTEAEARGRLQGRREALESGIDYQRGRIAGLAEAMKLFKDHGNCYDPQSGHEFENALRIRIDGDPHVHVAGTKDECALCGKDLGDPIHLRSKLKKSKNL